MLKTWFTCICSFVFSKVTGILGQFTPSVGSWQTISFSLNTPDVTYDGTVPWTALTTLDLLSMMGRSDSKWYDVCHMSCKFSVYKWRMIIMMYDDLFSGYIYIFPIKIDWFMLIVNCRFSHDSHCIVLFTRVLWHFHILAIGVQFTLQVHYNDKCCN